jgi:hypothetical protein
MSTDLNIEQRHVHERIALSNQGGEKATVQAPQRRCESEGGDRRLLL